MDAAHGPPDPRRDRAPSVGSRGDAYDDALAESVLGLFKTEVIRRRGPWRPSSVQRWTG